MTAEYRSASETVRRALRKLRDEGLVATQSTRGTFVLRKPAEPGPDTDLARMEEAIRAAEARLTRHIDSEIAKLREELEYTQAQVMALDARAGGTPSRGEGVG
jgi:DNA-binding GntR family transcriptional regulator